MTYVDVWRDTIIASEDIPPQRFVGIDGSLGGDYGVTQFGASTGEEMEVLVLGAMEIPLATGQTFVEGDLISPDAQGLAVVDNATGRFKAKPNSPTTVIVVLK